MKARKIIFENFKDAREYGRRAYRKAVAVEYLLPLSERKNIRTALEYVQGGSDGRRAATPTEVEMWWQVESEFNRAFAIEDKIYQRAMWGFSGNKYARKKFLSQEGIDYKCAASRYARASDMLAHWLLERYK